LEFRLSTSTVDQDNFWKEIVNAYFSEFMAFFFPTAYADIDWDKKYEFLDTELAGVLKDSEVGKRRADKLVKVFLKEGGETWLLIHLEIQGYYDLTFAERMFIYNYRIYDFYAKDVVSFALLTDKNRKYRPNEYKRNRWGFEQYTKFPMVKLIDLAKDWDKLEADPNPFALVAMAQLKTMRLKSPNSKLEWKLTLMEMLQERGYSDEEAKKLFKFLDWVVSLPEDLKIKFDEEVAKRSPKIMPYITSFERSGMLDIVFIVLNQKFKELKPELVNKIRELNAEQIKVLSSLMISFNDESELMLWLNAQQRNN
jgi:Domain of unknown function (DUF4351)